MRRDVRALRGRKNVRQKRQRRLRRRVLLRQRCLTWNRKEALSDNGPRDTNKQGPIDLPAQSVLVVNGFLDMQAQHANQLFLEAL
jgi:hypothetical protein